MADRSAVMSAELSGVAAVGTIVLDPNGVVRALDAVAERSFGWSDADARGQHSRVLFGDSELCATRDDSIRELAARRRDGSTFPARVRLAEVTLDGASTLIALVEDLSPQEQAIVARRALDDRVARLLELAAVVPWEADAVTGQFTWVGPGALALLGHRVEDWYARDFWSHHIHEDDRGRVVNFCVDACSRHRDYEAEYRMRHRDGHFVWVHDVIRVTQLAGVPKMLSGFLIDITERKHAEEQQNVLRQQLRDALRDREEFLGLASHELRTPLTPLKLQLRRMKRTLRDQNLDTKGADASLEAFERIETLVETLLDATALSHGRLPTERARVDLTDVARTVVEKHRRAAARRGSTIEVRSDGPLIGMFAQVELEKLLSHLLSNAVKYGAGRAIEVQIARAGDRARCTVSDHGLGLAADDAKRIFDRFERAVSSSHYGGLGLGLFVAREIARAHGGSISVESTPGTGASFVVELPLEG